MFGHTTQSKSLKHCNCSVELEEKNIPCDGATFMYLKNMMFPLGGAEQRVIA